MKQEYYIGIMSGTSLDGVDVVLFRIDDTACELVSAYEHPFPVALKEDILDITRSTVTLAKIGELDHRLGVLFAEAVNAFVAKESIDAASVIAVGSHGQTLWHQPEGAYPFTMQSGDPNIIAAKTGMPVVADFRRKDMAFGGSGAPLAPAFHQFLFGKADGRICIANIGGIANITVLGERLLGYDTGPGNMLMDAWIQKHLNKRYDKDGVWARSGQVDYALLDVMMEDTYFKQDYPKSTGRERFNEAWLDEMITRRGRAVSLPNNLSAKGEGRHAGQKGRHMGLPLQDVQRTLLELTALSLSNEVLKFNPDILMLCGGGAQNSFLVERIAALMPNIQVGVMEHADSLEAMMMAWLAYKRIHEEQVELMAVTGASQNTVLGAIYL